jgi:hypothetical protein
VGLWSRTDHTVVVALHDAEGEQRGEQPGVQTGRRSQVRGVRWSLLQLGEHPGPGGRLQRGVTADEPFDREHRRLRWAHQRGCSARDSRCALSAANCLGNVMRIPR